MDEVTGRCRFEHRDHSGMKTKKKQEQQKMAQEMKYGRIYHMNDGKPFKANCTYILYLFVNVRFAKAR